MKKTIVVIVLMVMAVAAFAQQAVIREVSGTVEVKASGASSYVAANPGDRVAEDTLVSTSFKSSALIEAGSVTILVRPLTRLTLTEIRSSMGDETLNVNLAAGRVHVDVSPPAGTKSSLSIVTPPATASVRGTSFELDTRGLYVIEGRVGYRDSNGNLVYVDAGFNSMALADGSLSDPYNNIRAGYPPAAPVGYDPLSAPSVGGSITLYIPSQAPSSPSTPSSPSGPSGPSGPSSSGTGNDGGGEIDILGWI